METAKKPDEVVELELSKKSIVDVGVMLIIAGVIIYALHRVINNHLK